MKTGIFTHNGNHGRYRQGDVIFAEPTNRQMRRLAAKQAGNEKGRPPAPNPNTGYVSSNKSRKEV